MTNQFDKRMKDIESRIFRSPNILKLIAICAIVFQSILLGVLLSIPSIESYIYSVFSVVGILGCMYFIKAYANFHVKLIDKGILLCGARKILIPWNDLKDISEVEVNYGLGAAAISPAQDRIFITYKKYNPKTSRYRTETTNIGSALIGYEYFKIRVIEEMEKRGIEVKMEYSL